MPRKFEPSGGARPHRGGSGSLSYRLLPSGKLAIVHPPCIAEREDDYADAMSIWEAGEPEEAREALREALRDCGDNIFVHAALGRLALEAFKDPSLARAHSGYAVELARNAIPHPAPAQLDPGHPDNRPLLDALETLAECLRSLGAIEQLQDLRRLQQAWLEPRGEDRRRR